MVALRRDRILSTGTLPVCTMASVVLPPCRDISVATCISLVLQSWEKVEVRWDRALLVKVRERHGSHYEVTVPADLTSAVN